MSPLPRRLGRAIGYGAVALLMLLLVFVILALALANTERGSRWVLDAAARYLPEGLEIGALEGTLASPLTLRHLRYEAEGLHLELQFARVHWRLPRLLDLQVQVDALEARGLRVRLEPAAPASAPPPAAEPALLALPVDLILNQLELLDASLQTGPASEAQPLLLDRLALNARWTDDGLAITELQLRAPLLDVDGAARLTPPSGLAAATLRRGQARLAASTVELALTGDLRPDNLHPLTLTLAANGTLNALRIDGAVAEPYDLQLAGTLTDLLDRIGLDLALTARRLAPARIAAMPVDGAAGAASLEVLGALQLSVQGDLTELLVDGEASLTGPVWEVLAGPPAAGPGASETAISADLSLVYSPERLRIAALSLREQTDGLADGATFGARGLIELGGARPALDLQAQWQHLRWPLLEGPAVRSKRGELTVLGVLDDYRAVLEATVLTAAPGSPNGSPNGLPDDSPEDLNKGAPVAGTLQLTGAGSATAFRVDELALAAFGGSAHGQGQLDWADGLNGELQLDLQGLDFGALAPQWAGAVNGVVDAQLSQDDAQAPLALVLAPLQLDGELRGQPLQVDLALTAQLVQGNDAVPLVLAVQRGTARLGDNRIALAGELTETALALTFDLQAADVSQLEDSLRGSLAAIGAVGGTWQQPELRGTIDVPVLTVAGQRVEALNGTLALGLSPTFDQSVQIELAALAGDLALGATTLALHGPLADHRLSIATRLVTPADPLGLTLQQQGTARGLPEQLAGYQRADALAAFVYEFALAELALTLPSAETLSLREGGNGRLASATQSLSLARTCLAGDVATLCAALTLAADRDGAATLALNAVPLPWANPWLPPELRLAGNLSGEGQLRLPAGAGLEPEGQLALKVADVALARGDDVVLRFEPLTLDVSADASGAALRAELPLAQAGPAASPAGAGASIRLNLQPSAAPIQERPLAGDFQLRLPDLSWVAELAPEVGRLEGRLDAALSLRGTPAAPVASGELRLDAPQLDLPEPNLALRDLRLAVVADDMVPGSDIALRVDGGFLSGGGEAAIAGDLGYSAGALSAALTLTGERVQLSNTEQAVLFASPDLQLRLADELLQVRGRIEIPEADIAVNTVPASAVTVSSDQVFVDTEGQQAQSTALRYDADLTVALGERVRFEGFGLDARFAGSLNVKQRTGEQALGNGEISVQDGRYQAYGQDLAIETGRALWSDSPIEEPGIDLRAVRKPRPDVLVGVRARGQLDAPDFSLFSTPSMGESDQLSYLVLGRPIEDNSSAESSLLTQAALALSIRGGNFLSDRFGGQLGVDQIGIETEAGAGTAGAAFVVGKYLTPRLYVSYGLGLLDSVSTMKLEYLLSSRWRLSTESSTVESGGDLVYTIERD